MAAEANRLARIAIEKADKQIELQIQSSTDKTLDAILEHMRSTKVQRDGLHHLPEHAIDDGSSQNDSQKQSVQKGSGPKFSKEKRSKNRETLRKVEFERRKALNPRHK